MDSEYTTVLKNLDNDSIADGQTFLIVCGCTLVTILASLLYFFVFSKTKRQLPVLMIVGSTQTGKTTLMNQLMKQASDDSTQKESLTVMSQDISKFIDKKNQMEIIEFPGHFKLRYKITDFLNNHIFGLTGNKRQKQMTNSKLKIIVMIDSTLRDWENDCKLIVDILEIIESENMKDLNIKKNKTINLLLACNKNESFTARPVIKIKEIIENDINEILQRSKKSINKIEDNDNVSSNTDKKHGINNGNRYGGEITDNGNDKIDLIIDKKFKFDMLETEVEFIGGSAKDGKIEAWLDWIRN